MQIHKIHPYVIFKKIIWIRKRAKKIVLAGLKPVRYKNNIKDFHLCICTNKFVLPKYIFLSSLWGAEIEFIFHVMITCVRISLWSEEFFWIMVLISSRSAKRTINGCFELPNYTGDSSTCLLFKKIGATSIHTAIKRKKIFHYHKCKDGNEAGRVKYFNLCFCPYRETFLYLWYLDDEEFLSLPWKNFFLFPCPSPHENFSMLYLRPSVKKIIWYLLNIMAFL